MHHNESYDELVIYEMFYLSKIIKYITLIIIIQIVLISINFGGQLLIVDGVTTYHTDYGV